MGRTLVSGVVGGLVFYIWGMLAWMAIPIHVPSMAGLPNEAAVTAALKAGSLESGVYTAPWSDDEEDWSNPESEWFKRHQAGPVYTIFYRQDGCSPMDPMVMVGGLVIDLLGAILAAFMLCAALPTCRRYWQRVAFISGFGVFVAIIAHLGYWNWMNFSTAWTLGFVVDCIVGWVLAGAAMAAIQKPPAGSAAESVAA